MPKNKNETEEAREDLKKSVFNNTMLCSFADQRKYIRNVKAIMDSGYTSSDIKKQNKIAEEIEEKKDEFGIKNKADLDSFIKANEELVEDLQVSMDNSLLQSKKAQTKSKPSQIVSKSLSMLMDVDTRIIEKLNDEEKNKLSKQLNKLNSAIAII